MDSRLTFRPRSATVTSQEGTQEGRPTGGWLSRVKQVGGGSWEIRIPVTAETRIRARAQAKAKWPSPH
jgi:hypothetical protein